jgi:hypothetical protein
MYKTINAISITDDRIGDNILFLPVIRSLSEYAEVVNWQVKGIAQDIVKFFIPENVNVKNKVDHKGAYTIDLLRCGKLWRSKNKSTDELWCPSKKILFDDWNKYNMNTQKLVSNIYGIQISDYTRFSLGVVPSLKSNNIVLAPDAYLSYNQIPMKILESICERYNPLLIYSDKNEKKYKHLKGSHFVNMSAWNLINVISSAKFVIAGMTGIAHLSSLVGTQTYILCFRPQDLGWFTPLFTDVVKIDVVKKEKLNAKQVLTRIGELI